MSTLTDSMIANKLSQQYPQNQKPDFLLIIVVLLLFAFCVYLCYKSKKPIEKFAIVIFIILFSMLIISSSLKQLNIRTKVANNDWVVSVDTVKRTQTGTTRGGQRTFLVVLDEYDNESVDNAYQLNQYKEGDQVYVVLINCGFGYQRIGSIYSTEKYTYNGERLLIE
jgi:hypothetical protein